MKQIYQDLWQSELGNHFGLDLKTYLLKTPNGNMLFYYSNSEKEQQDILNLGGVDIQFISHHHEFQKGLFSNLNLFKPKLTFHKKSLKYCEINYNNNELITDSFHLLGIDIINTPGHTDTNLCFYYPSPTGKNYLFTGDTFYLDNDIWNTLIMKHEGGSKESLKQSLLELRKLNVDVICCSVSTRKNRHIEVNQDEWRQIIDGLISNL